MHSLFSLLRIKIKLLTVLISNNKKKCTQNNFNNGSTCTLLTSVSQLLSKAFWITCSIPQIKLLCLY